MSFAALRITEPPVVSAESTSRRLLSPTLALAFSYFGFLHVIPIKKWETSVARCLPNTPIGLRSNRHITYSNIIVIVCDYVI